ncbi:protein folded gastrulation [Lucilia sericata]|uniref:protein folded gastrulation n=1 Tax=Lucilia sericata TaxID=13632 RepID=UPI0018A7ED1B|nr:protein folded gastrulation [Lucilia sericata]XP_037809839.1 protein folded gastrulation [Lucilia sericata]XP_037809840.1 protein folded gastrulation [Lucilia sericata]
MNFTPTIFIVKLLAAMQVLMTLDMPLSTTMALPVTSKPIESTVENLAWQAWIELPPEQKQQVKSRKVTPKSIFTLPLRVECPEGHKQVDTKCIPIVIGSNDVLIDLNALGLLVGNTQTDELYDYDDMGEEMGSSLPYGSEMPMGEAEKSVEGITVELKPPSKDEPLKFNIFENKFNIFHEEPLEDYSSISNEGVQSSEKEQNVTLTTPQATNKTTVAQANITDINDLVSEASNISENSFEIYMQREKSSTSSTDNVAEESYTLTTLADDPDFRIEAISLPAAGFEVLKPNKLSIIQNDSSVQLVTSIMDTDRTTSKDDHDKHVENDLQTLLQTESFLPMLQQATATTLQDTNVATAESSSLTTISAQEPSESSLDTLSLNVDNEEMTTLPNVMEQDGEVKDKQEYTRSVTINPLMIDDSDADDNGNNDEVKDTTLESVTNDEPLETTTPIQLDDTTIIETSSSLSTTPATQVELKELLLQQEQAQKDFEELQRMRKGQKDQQHVVLKKSKVEPVKVLSTTTEAATTTTTATNLPTETETKTQDEFVTKTAETAMTPLLTVHNENDNNDRFYYQHFAKQDSEELQSSGSVTTTMATASAEAAATKATEIETIPLSSEIDLAEELRLINELVKGIRPATTLTTIKSMQATTTTTTENPTTKTTIKTTLPDKIQSSTSPVSLSESSTIATKPTPSTLQIWSKIMPLLTPTTSTTPKSSSQENLKTTTESSTLSTQEVSNDIQISEPTSSSSMRSNRNSKIIRINGFNSISTGKASTTSTSTTTEETTTIEDSSASSKSENLESSTENNTYQPYWWLPVAWRLDKPISSEKQLEEEQEVKSEEQPLLLRFWSAYHAPKSS